MPSPIRRLGRLPRRLAMMLAAAVLPGCAGMFAVDEPAAAPRLYGRVEGVAPIGPGQGCDPLGIELAVLYDAAAQPYPGGGQLTVGAVHGHAEVGQGYAGRPLESAVPRLQPWLIEGEIYENGVAVLTLYRETYFASGTPDAIGAKPYSVFRGAITGDRIEAVEQEPSCGRRLVASADPAGIGPVPDWRRP